jgi:DNA-directed RNA polymerase specialized sigma24 family protein
MFREHATQLVDQARAGEIDGLIEYLYVRVRARAAHLVSGYRAAYGSRLDVDDVAQEGIERVLRILGAALGSADEPISWLLGAARLRMMNYCMENRGSIRVPRTSQRQGAKVPAVVSLDAPLPGTDDLTLLDVIGGR